MGFHNFVHFDLLLNEEQNVQESRSFLKINFATVMPIDIMPGT